jgi:hypothetical protein
MLLASFDGSELASFSFVSAGLSFLAGLLLVVWEMPLAGLLEFGWSCFGEL